MKGLFVFLVLAASGLFLVFYTTSVPQVTGTLSTSIVTDDFSQILGLASKDSVVDAHITASAPVTLKISIVGQVDLFEANSQTGTFDVIGLNVRQPGNIELSLKTVSGVFTTMSIDATLANLVTGNPYWLVGSAIVVVSSLMAVIPRAPINRLFTAGTRNFPLR